MSWRPLLVLLCGLSLVGPGRSRPVSPKEPAQFFQQKIRPLLLESCLSCHGPDKAKGGLDLSTRVNLLEGGSHGPAVVPGKSDESLLYRKVARGEMPPKKPLSPQQVADVKKWIDDGAAFDDTPLIAAKGKMETPWSFQPVARHEPPRTKFAALARNPIDHFLFQKLEQKGLAPAAIADRLTLLRRVTIDLTGLPPTPEEVERFSQDETPDAYEKVVDRLLASKSYGERWARHWLDVIRFGESHGYEQNHIRPSAWPFRDYVIQSFNDDKPFDRFLAEQLAGDILAPGDPSVEVATGFLVAGVHDTVGNGTEEGRRQQRVNDLEDIVSTVGASFLGLTLGCARCHDHKFDPITQKEYYQFSAVFAGVRHGERALSRKPGEDKNRDELLQRQRYMRIVTHEIDMDARARILKAQGLNPVPRPASNSWRNIDDFPAVQAKHVRFTILATRDGAEPCLDELEIFGPDGAENLALTASGAKATASSLLPGYKIHQIAHVHDGKYGNESSWISKERGKGWLQIELPKPAKINRVVWGRDSGEPARFFDRVVSVYRLEVSLDGKDWRTVASDKDRAIVGESLDYAALKKVLSADEMDRRNLLYEELDNLRRLSQVADPVKAYIGQFGTPDPIFFLKRGDVMQRGDVVNPAALAALRGVAAELDAELLKTEPGRRLALARWLTDAKNPLTARVMVNRLWQHHFGRGLVATPSDFGNQGAKPSHPELLDWLASDLVAGGWRLKRLHRLMVTSHAYRQSSALAEKVKAVDADNVLLARMPLRRMEAEVLRDAILSAGGKLDRRMGGAGYALFKYRIVNVAIYEPLEQFAPETWRRTIYAVTPRAIRADLLATFDCPESAQRTPRRDVTTTPLQALSLLNGPFAVQQAEFFAQRVEKAAGNEVDEQVTLAFRLAFGRAPTMQEMRAASELVQRRGLVALCRGLLNANEFIYY